MRRLTPHIAAVQHSIAFGLLGYLSLASAQVSALLAGSHAFAGGAICGAAQIPHCGWCYATAAFAMAGAAAFAAAARPTLQARARPAS